jgi:hypothetical protein
VIFAVRRFQVIAVKTTHAAAQVLHLIKSQCGSSTLVIKVKLVERCFVNGFTVKFEMYDSAPTGTQLPYFSKPDGSVINDEIDLAQYLSTSGAAPLSNAGSVDAAALQTVLDGSPEVGKTVKTATKSKTEEVCMHLLLWICIY